MHITRSASGTKGSGVGIRGSETRGKCSGRRVGAKRVVQQQEQQLPDFRITGSVPPKVLPGAHRFAPRIRSPRSRKLPCFRDDTTTISITTISITTITTTICIILAPTLPRQSNLRVGKLALLPCLVGSR